MVLLLRYWDLRALGEPSRLLLRYTGDEWEDKVIELKIGNREKWYAEKHNMGLDFPNLPYLIDGDVKITQSLAIIRYLGRKYKLAPSNDVEQLRCDMAEQEIMDMKMAHAKICYNPKIAELKSEYLTTLTVKLKLMDKFLSSRPWALGEKMTYVDFLIYEFLDQIRIFAPDHFKDSRNILDYLNRFEALPAMKKWFDSDKYKEGAYIHSPTAAWHGKE